ncbi:MAG: hypothetical protein K0R84_1233 [Clostridia bacterium]|nr:hypothetical protein [Clostridia bacterium]
MKLIKIKTDILAAIYLFFFIRIFMLSYSLNKPERGNIIFRQDKIEILSFWLIML